MDVCTREYLQNLPIQRRKEFVNQQCEEYRRRIIDIAARGNTNCLISVSSTNAQGSQVLTTKKSHNHLDVGAHIGLRIAGQITDPPSTEEIIEYLKEKFPDCKVSYEEQWQDVAPGRRELKKGILVDWS
jgi:hypothetical protein